MKSPNILLSLVAAVTVTFGFSTSAVQGQESCGGDNNGDGLVNGVDLAIVLGAWGVCPGTVTSVTPLQGSILGGTQITINGTNLAGTTAVKIGGVAPICRFFHQRLSRQSRLQAQLVKPRFQSSPQQEQFSLLLLLLMFNCRFHQSLQIKEFIPVVLQSRSQDHF